MKYDSPSPGTGKSFMACSSGGINRSSKIFVIFVPVGPRAAGPGITAGVVLTAAVFSGIFGCVAGILPPVSAFSAGTVIFGFSSGFFCSGTGAGFTVAAFSGSFGGVTGVLLSASAFSAGAAAFGFSSAFFCSGSGAAFYLGCLFRRLWRRDRNFVVCVGLFRRHSHFRFFLRLFLPRCGCRF